MPKSGSANQTSRHCQRPRRHQTSNNRIAGSVTVDGLLANAAAPASNTRRFGATATACSP